MKLELPKLNLGDIFTKETFDSVKESINQNAPLITTTLCIVGSIGAVATAYKVSPKAHQLLKYVENTSAEDDSKAKIFWRKTKAVAPVVWPILLMEGVSIGCAISSYEISAERISALAAAYALSEKRLNDYSQEVVKQIGKTKESKIRDAVAAEEVKRNPLGAKNEVVILPGSTLCYDGMSGRYFMSDIETIRGVINVLNDRLRNEMYVSLNDFYYELGLTEINVGDLLGWNVNSGEIDLDFRSTIAENKQPCVTLNYMCEPKFDYRNLH